MPMPTPIKTQDIQSLQYYATIQRMHAIFSNCTYPQGNQGEKLVGETLIKHIIDYADEHPHWNGTPPPLSITETIWYLGKEITVTITKKTPGEGYTVTFPGETRFKLSFEVSNSGVLSLENNVPVIVTTEGTHPAPALLPEKTTLFKKSAKLRPAQAEAIFNYAFSVLHDPDPASAPTTPHQAGLAYLGPSSGKTLVEVLIALVLKKGILVVPNDKLKADVMKDLAAMAEKFQYTTEIPSDYKALASALTDESPVEICCLTFAELQKLMNSKTKTKIDFLRENIIFMDEAHEAVPTYHKALTDQFRVTVSEKPNTLFLTGTPDSTLTQESQTVASYSVSDAIGKVYRDYNSTIIASANPLDTLLSTRLFHSQFLEQGDGGYQPDRPVLQQYGKERSFLYVSDEAQRTQAKETLRSFFGESTVLGQAKSISEEQKTAYVQNFMIYHDALLASEISWVKNRLESPLHKKMIDIMSREIIRSKGAGEGTYQAINITDKNRRTISNECIYDLWVKTQENPENFSEISYFNTIVQQISPKTPLENSIITTLSSIVTGQNFSLSGAGKIPEPKELHNQWMRNNPEKSKALDSQEWILKNSETAKGMTPEQIKTQALQLIHAGGPSTSGTPTPSFDRIQGKSLQDVSSSVSTQITSLALSIIFGGNFSEDKAHLDNDYDYLNPLLSGENTILIRPSDIKNPLTRENIEQRLKNLKLQLIKAGLNQEQSTAYIDIVRQRVINLNQIPSIQNATKISTALLNIRIDKSGIEKQIQDFKSKNIQLEAAQIGLQQQLTSTLTQQEIKKIHRKIQTNTASIAANTDQIINLESDLTDINTEIQALEETAKTKISVTITDQILSETILLDDIGYECSTIADGTEPKIDEQKIYKSQFGLIGSLILSPKYAAGLSQKGLLLTGMLVANNTDPLKEPANAYQASARGHRAGGSRAAVVTVCGQTVRNLVTSEHAKSAAAAEHLQAGIVRITQITHLRSPQQDLTERNAAFAAKLKSLQDRTPPPTDTQVNDLSEDLSEDLFEIMKVCDLIMSKPLSTGTGLHPYDEVPMMSLLRFPFNQIRQKALDKHFAYLQQRNPVNLSRNIWEINILINSAKQCIETQDFMALHEILLALKQEAGILDHAIQAADLKREASMPKASVLGSISAKLASVGSVLRSEGASQRSQKESQQTFVTHTGTTLEHIANAAKIKLDKINRAYYTLLTTIITNQSLTRSLILYIEEDSKQTSESNSLQSRLDLDIVTAIQRMSVATPQPTAGARKKAKSPQAAPAAADVVLRPPVVSDPRSPEAGAAPAIKKATVLKLTAKGKEQKDDEA